VCAFKAYDSHSIVNEGFILDGIERLYIGLHDGEFFGKSAIPSLLPAKENELLSAIISVRTLELQQH
jgi:hypothetical protein